MKCHHQHAHVFISEGFSNTGDCYSNHPVELLLGVREIGDGEFVSLDWAYFS